MVVCSPLEGLERELAATCPDVIVLGLPAFAERNHPTLLGTRLQVARSSWEPPLIAWAPWGERDVIPARGLVDAVVPLELPLSAAAHRVFVLAKRSMQGHVLDSRLPARASLRPPPRLPQRTAPPAEVPASSDGQSKTDGKPTADGKPTVRRIPINGIPTPAHGVARASLPPPSEAREDGAWESPASRPPGGRSVRPSTSPSTIRVPLSSPRESSSGVRVVLIDHDLTRADALLTTLRARRIQVHPTSPELADLHLRLTRRFSPHGIVVDETVLRTRGARLIETMRSDPFLQHAQLLVVDLSKLFRAEVGATSLQPLIPLLESLGQAESALFDKLGPTCEVELGFDEIPAHLLLRLLSTRTLWTDLSCCVDSECLEWCVSNAGCGPAELTRGKAPPQNLSVESAIRWMLENPEARVVVTQRPTKDIFQPRELTPVIDRMIRDWCVPTELERFSMRPSPRASDEAPPSRPSSLAWSDAVPLSVASAASASSASPHQNSAPPVALSESPRTQRGGRARWWMAAAVVAGLGLVGLVLGGASKLPQAEQEPTGAKSAEVAASAVVAHSKQRVQPADAASLSAANPSAEPSVNTIAEPAKEKGPDSSTEPAASFGRILRVPASACRLKKCVARESSLSAARLIQRARKDLMEGRNASAHEQLCSAADKSPEGEGSLALSRFYLDHHCPQLAQEAAGALLASEVGELELRLLRADWESQLGRSVEGAHELASGIGVASDDTATLQAVSRKYFRDALTAFRHSSAALAERDLRRAVMLWPEHGAAASWLAHVLERRGLRQVARTWAQWVVEHSPDSQMARGVLTRTDSSVGDSPL